MFECLLDAAVNTAYIYESLPSKDGFWHNKEPLGNLNSPSNSSKIIKIVPVMGHW